MCEIRVISVPYGQVSWLRRRGPEMSLLTTNQLVFSVDNRLSVSYDKNSENWGLVIQSAQERDSASYLCQVSHEDSECELGSGQECMLLLIGKHLV